MPAWIVGCSPGTRIVTAWAGFANRVRQTDSQSVIRMAASLWARQIEDVVVSTESVSASAVDVKNGGVASS